MEKNKLTEDIQLIIIGGSAGSLEPVFRIFEKMKSDFPVPFLVVLHRNAEAESGLTELIRNKTRLQAKDIEDKEELVAGTIHICPPDYHVLVEADRSLSLDYSEKENFSRPSIDVIFRSAADVYTRHLVCILLSGANADGAQGIHYAKTKGAISIVQDPKEASVAYMPEQALLRGQTDFVLTAEEISYLLLQIPATKKR